MGALHIAMYAVLVFNITLSECCPQICRCDKKRKIVFCNERALVRVPYGIPSDTKVLLLQGNHLENSPSLEAALSRLTVLERLDMHENKLTSFPNGLPGTLTYLSLRSNQIKFIGKNTMDGLSHLKELQLDSNNITNRGLGSLAFSGATKLEDLALSNNAFTSFPENLPSSLKSIRLANNRIRSVSKSALSALKALLRLDLSSNKISGRLTGLDQLTLLKTLNLKSNLLENVPPNLPFNLTVLILSFNRLQYVYTHRNADYGDLQGLEKLRKLDLSSNNLRSIEKGSFNALPTSLSIELQNNPWGCDCNLLYLKRWLTFTTSILGSSNGIKCATPPMFSGVTLEAIDAEALKCEHSSYLIKINQIRPTKVIIQYDIKAKQEPPFVTYSVMYGVMLCEDCSLQGGISTPSHSSAHMWMEDYTIEAIVPSIPTEISDLKPNTRYAICVVTSYQHPDQVSIEQCEDVRTSLEVTKSTPIQDHIIPSWTETAAAVAAAVVLTAIVVAIVLWYRRRRRRSLHSYIRPQRHIVTTSSIPYVAGKERPLVDANSEFDVTLMIRKDLKRQSDSCNSDSHDESLATLHTETTAPNHIDHIYPEGKTDTTSHPRTFLPMNNDVAVNLRSDGLYL